MSSHFTVPLASGGGAAAAAFLVIAIGALGCVAGGRLGDRWGRTRTTALSMMISGTCAGLIGFLRPTPVGVVLAVALAWGFWVVADSAQFSAMVTELADQRTLARRSPFSWHSASRLPW